MDRPHGKDPGTARGTRKVLEPHAMHKGLHEGLEYLKEATVVMDTMNNKGIKADDIIKAVTMKIGNDKLLAVRPKNSLEYELTLTCADECDDLIDGVEIKEQLCVVRRLELKECVVSFVHLPAYVKDETIEDKLKLWGVTPITKIKRRLYPGTDIADGTSRFRLRPYHFENARSRLISEAKQGRAWLVLGWETAWEYQPVFGSRFRLRPYHFENARSRLISEAKQGRSWLVLGWETAWEYQVLRFRLRPYHFENARSRLISEAKQGRAWLVLGWETAWEYQVL
ncbi:unnamed protein product [Leuciscus chuanchicus]